MNAVILLWACKGLQEHHLARYISDLLTFPSPSLMLTSLLCSEQARNIPPWSLCLAVPSAATAAAKSLQSCPTLCDPIDGSPPGSPIPRILQARTLAVPSTWSLFRRYSPVSSFSVQACAQWGRGGPSLAPLAKKSNPPSILFLLFLTFLRL